MGFQIAAIVIKWGRQVYPMIQQGSGKISMSPGDVGEVGHSQRAPGFCRSSGSVEAKQGGQTPDPWFRRQAGLDGHAEWLEKSAGLSWDTGNALRQWKHMETARASWTFSLFILFSSSFFFLKDIIQHVFWSTKYMSLGQIFLSMYMQRLPGSIMELIEPQSRCYFPAMMLQLSSFHLRGNVLE